MEKIIVIGGGGNAKVVISILKKLNKYKIVGYTDNDNRGTILGVKYLGNDDILEKFYNEGVRHAVIGIGQLKSTKIRRKISEKITSIGYDCPCIISPDSIINEAVDIGDGTVIMDGVIVNSGTKIGKFCIINTRGSIDHDCNIGDFTHVAGGVILAGGVVIGNDVFIGLGVNVIQYKQIVDNSIIGAGSTVIDSIGKAGTYVGNPVRLV